MDVKICISNQIHVTFSAFRILKVIASLLSPTAFALGSINFADYERAHVGLRWNNIWRVSSHLTVYLSRLTILYFCYSWTFVEYVPCRHRLEWIFWCVSWWCCLTHFFTVLLVFIWIRYVLYILKVITSLFDYCRTVLMIQSACWIMLAHYFACGLPHSLSPLKCCTSMVYARQYFF